MKVKQRLVVAAARALGRRGFEVRRHPARRRQALLARHGVDLVLDVGAADGGYGRELREFGYTGRIVSFEPLSEAHARLAARIADDPRWTSRNLALGSSSGEAVINVASNSNSSSLLAMLGAHIDSAPDIRYVGTEDITVSRLDDLLDGLGPADGPFLKIDTQGFEREVLAGATETVRRCVGLQLELSFVPLYEGSMLVDEALGWAYDHGFRLTGFEQGYAAPDGRVLQADGVFFRTDT